MPCSLQPRSFQPAAPGTRQTSASGFPAAAQQALHRSPDLSALEPGFRSKTGGGRGGTSRPTATQLIFSLLALLAAVSLPAQAFSQTTSPILARIRQTHVLRCGINQETPEYSSTDDHGPRQAFDADLCRAVAVAILGPAARTITTPYPDDVAAMAALRTGKVDLLPTLTLDLTHAAIAFTPATQAILTHAASAHSSGTQKVGAHSPSAPSAAAPLANPGSALAFSPPVLYDGVGLLVPVSAQLSHASELSGKKICFLAETQVELSLRAWFQRQGLHFAPFPFQEEGEMEAAFVTGNCAALAGDRTRLAHTRLSFGAQAANYALLPDQLAADPLATASLASDPAFARIVEWTLEVLLNAEQAGLTVRSLSAGSHSSAPEASDANVPSAPEAASGSASSLDPTVAILTGQTRQIGARLGLDNAWTVHVLAAVGNYGELYDRDLGDHSPLQLPRDQNRLASQGGLMLPLPLK